MEGKPPLPSVVNINLQQHPSGIIPRVINVISTADFKCHLQLPQIACNFPKAFYNPRKFIGVIVHNTSDPVGESAIIYASGKVVVSGSTSIDASKKFCIKIYKLLRKFGYPVLFTKFKIRNVITSYELNFPVNIYALKHYSGERLRILSERNLSALYLFEGLDVTASIYPKGIVIINHAPTYDESVAAFEALYPILLLCNHQIVKNVYKTRGITLCRHKFDVLPVYPEQCQIIHSILNDFKNENNTDNDDVIDIEENNHVSDQLSSEY